MARALFSSKSKKKGAVRMANVRVRSGTFEHFFIIIVRWIWFLLRFYYTYQYDDVNAFPF